jgi:hypothetical protein
MVDGSETHDLEAFWHFAPDLTVQGKENRFIVSSSDQQSWGASLAILSAGNPRWDAQISSSATSPVYGQTTQSPILRMHARLKLPAENAILIAPNAHGKPNYGDVSLAGLLENTLSHNAFSYRYAKDDEEHYFIFKKSGQTWREGLWTSDADFFYCHVQGGQLTHLIFCDGSFAAINGRTVVAAEKTVDRFEWRQKGGREEIYSSDNDALGPVSISSSLIPATTDS